MREVGKKTPKKVMDNPSFYDVTWLFFKTLCPPTYYTNGMTDGPKI